MSDAPYSYIDRIRKLHRDAIRKHGSRRKFKIVLGEQALERFFLELLASVKMIGRGALISPRDLIEPPEGPAEFMGMFVTLGGSDFDVWVLPIDQSKTKRPQP